MPLDAALDSSPECIRRRTALAPTCENRTPKSRLFRFPSTSGAHFLPNIPKLQMLRRRGTIVALERTSPPTLPVDQWRPCSLNPRYRLRKAVPALPVCPSEFLVAKPRHLPQNLLAPLSFVAPPSPNPELPLPVQRIRALHPTCKQPNFADTPVVRSFEYSHKNCVPRRCQLDSP